THWRVISSPQTCRIWCRPHSISRTQANQPQADACRWIVSRYRINNMTPAGGSSADQPAPPSRTAADQAAAMGPWGGSPGPASLILSSLADGAKHGYALTKDIEAFAGVRLAPGTLYEALSRLEAHGMIEAVESHDRRRPYRLTATGAAALS